MTCAPRRLWALVRGLPSDSAVQRGDGWSVETELQAVLIERLDGWGSALFGAATLGKLRKDWPLDVPGGLTLLRPADARREAEEKANPPKRRVDPERMKRIISALGLGVG